MALGCIIELESKEILGISITKERNMLLAERFISSLVGIHDSQHPVSTDGGDLVSIHKLVGSLEIASSLIHSSYEKSIIERTMQYIKDRTECFVMTISLAERRIVNYYMCGIG